LKRGEVERIASGECISAETVFPGATLTYTLEVSGVDRICAELEENRLIIRLPIEDARDWADSEAVSLFADQEFKDSKVLSILIEKDFACLSPGEHRSCDDDDDTFPHPDSGSLTC